MKDFFTKFLAIPPENLMLIGYLLGLLFFIWTWKECKEYILTKDPNFADDKAAYTVTKLLFTIGWPILVLYTMGSLTKSLFTDSDVGNEK